MDSFTGRIMNKLRCAPEALDSEACRARAGMLEGRTSIIVNIVLFAVKAALGVAVGSVALIADAFHTLSDVLTSVVVFVSFKLSAKEPDEEHPFGHGRMESVATLIVALMIVAGIELFETAVKRILHPEIVTASIAVIAVVAVTIVIKEALARFSRGLGRAIDSYALEADFWHHRIDAISSALVVAALAGQRLGFYYLDGIAGVLVSVLVAYTGWDIARKGVNEILGTRPSAEFVTKVKKSITAFPQVYDVHDLIVHEYGKKVILSFHIEVPESLSFKEAHNLADSVEKAVNKEFNTFATVHVDPVNLSDPELVVYREFLDSLAEDLTGYPSVSFHDIRLVKDGVVKNLLFDVHAPRSAASRELKSIKKIVRGKLMSEFPSLDNVIIEIEPAYAL